VRSDFCQSRSDLTGFTRNFFLKGCNVRRLQRIALRNAISRPAGFLSDLFLWSKESAGREGAGDGEKDESLFHEQSHLDPLSVECKKHARQMLLQQLGDLRPA
jgi:hypothetical protein